MATTYYVSGSGNDNNDGLGPKRPFRTIQTAADRTQPGDVVYVMDGVYTVEDPLKDIVSITRSGTPDAWITYKAYPGAKPKLVSKNWHAFAILGASYIIIDGFKLQGNNDNITVKQATAEQNNLANPLTSGNGIGVLPPDEDPSRYPHHIIIQNNEVYEFGGGGISTNNADYVTILNNVVYNNAWYSPFSESGISNYQNWNSDGNTGYKMIIRGNSTYNNKNLVPWYKTGRITDGNGIIVDDSRNTQDDSTLGLYQGRTLIENNISYANGGRGINVFKSNFVDIFNNTTYRNSRRPEIDSGEIIVNRADDVRVFNNIMNAAAGKAANDFIESTNVQSDYNLLFNTSNYSLVGPNDLIGADPQFIDPLAGNFALRSNSPAINRGINGLTNADILGTLRPQISRTDIGAFEGIGIIRGTQTHNRLVGTQLADLIDGGNGDDRILGRDGNDWLVGNLGNDILLGQDGNDSLIGGLGRDQLRGGLGRDTFALKPRGGLDVITDFQSGQDYLGLPENTNFSRLEFVQSGSDTVVKLGNSSLARLLNFQATQLHRSDFIFSNTFYQSIS